MHALFFAESRFHNEDWALRHSRAIEHPKPGTEAVIVGLIAAWVRYAEFSYGQHGRKIGDDAMLGPAWRSIGEHLLTLLNAELGRLDGGTLDAGIRNFALLQGTHIGE